MQTQSKQSGKMDIFTLLALPMNAGLKQVADRLEYLADAGHEFDSREYHSILQAAYRDGYANAREKAAKIAARSCGWEKHSEGDRVAQSIEEQIRDMKG